LKASEYGLYAMVARMRVLSSPAVERHADAVVGAIIDMVSSRRRAFAICARSSTASESTRFANAATICAARACKAGQSVRIAPFVSLLSQALGTRR
jgi:hypothetical protein